MKKKVLALLLGGAIAASGLSMQLPATVQAATHRFDECAEEDSSSHIKSAQVATVEGKLTVTIDIEFETENAYFCLYVFDKPLEPRNLFGYPFYDTGWGDDSAAKLEHLKESGTYTFDGLTDSQTYYVYCNAADNHEINGWGEGGDPNDVFWHYASYLGASGSDNSSGNNPPDNGSSDNDASGSTPSDSVPSGGSKAEETSYEGTVVEQIQAAEPGSTVVMKGTSSLPSCIMHELLEKKDVSLRLEFTYQDKEYVIVIPAGAALDEDVSWYGPLYLEQHFGNSAGSASSEAAGTYVVQSGDCLSRIAAANKMTLKQLLAKNPQIKNPDKINAGQIINR